MLLRSAAHSDIGRIRRANEDRLIKDDALRFYGVADGVGGLPGGAEAAQTATERLLELFSKNPDPRKLTEIVIETNKAVAQLGLRVSPRQGIGTTLTVGHFDGAKLRIAHVGDSRAYVWRKGQLHRLTQDHSVENELKARGHLFELANLSEHSRNALTRCIGQYTPLNVDIIEYEVQDGDRFLFCSDGITKMIREAELVHLLGAAVDPLASVTDLIVRANHRGGLDNATAVLIFALDDA